MTRHQNIAFDQDRFERFMGQIISDLGAAFSIGPIRIGGRLGLYATMAEAGPMTAADLARRTGCSERYLEEWLCHQAASGYVSYDAETRRYTLPPEHAVILADPESPAHALGGFCTAAALSENMEAVCDGFRTGRGVDWEDQSGCIACTVGEFFRPGYRANIVSHWLPALDGVVEKLRSGMRVADIGCGHGHSTRIMAEAFPDSDFVGIDPDADSIAAARNHAAAHGSHANLRFETGTAQALAGGPYGLVTCFDALHDMGDPVGAASAIRGGLAPGGSWMIVEPLAGDRVEENFTPIGRMSYAASTMTCVPSALSQAGGYALGAQAGEAKLRKIIVELGGLASLRRVAATPLNLVLEAKCA